MNVSSFFQEMIDLKEPFMRLGIKTNLFPAIPNNFTAKRLFLPLIWEKKKLLVSRLQAISASCSMLFWKQNNEAVYKKIKCIPNALLDSKQRPSQIGQFSWKLQLPCFRREEIFSATMRRNIISQNKNWIMAENKYERVTIKVKISCVYPSFSSERVLVENDSIKISLDRFNYRKNQVIFSA